MPANATSRHWKGRAYARGQFGDRPRAVPLALNDSRCGAEEAVALGGQLIDDLRKLSRQVVDFPGVFRLGEEMPHRFFVRWGRLLHQVMISRANRGEPPLVGRERLLPRVSAAVADGGQ